MNIEFTDRYSACGIPYPDPETMCPGDCEGMGVYPEHDIKVIEAAGKLDEIDDIGYVFLKCPTCNGTGKKI